MLVVKGERSGSRMVISRALTMRKTFAFLIAAVFVFSLFAQTQATPASSLLNLRDAYTDVSGGKSDKGEAHGKVKVPSGATFTSVKVGKKGEEIATFWSSKPNNAKATQAFIMIHGKYRDGGPYWQTMKRILDSAVSSKTSGADPNAIIVAPEFFSAKYNSGQYTKNQLAWGDTNAWQAGDPAVFPKGTDLTAFDALDAVVQTFFDQTKYPNMQRVTVVGHGGGGQLTQRYATVAEPFTTAYGRVHIRFIHGDPSSCSYFTTDRPKSVQGVASLPSKGSCPRYNDWRYGFSKFTGTSRGGVKSPQAYFQQYTSRDVVSIVGYQDTKPNGDNYCMAMMQGGIQRRDRNLVWWQYINTLARTNENLDGFPGTFDTLPDWSGVTRGTFNVQLVIVPDAAHDADAVFTSSEGRAALFQPGRLPKGWRPSSK